MKKCIISWMLVVVFLYPVNTASAVHIPVTGELDFQKKYYEITLNPNDKSPIALKLKQNSENQYHLLINIDHFKTPFFDISTILESTIELLHEEQNGGMRPLSGKIWSQYTLINYKPAQELTGQFEVRGDRIYLDYFLIGGISGKGWFQIAEPYQLNLDIYLTAIDLYEFITFFAGPKNIKAVGFVSGEINISGTADRIVLKGKPSTLEGIVDKLEFKSIVLNSEGVYPDIDVTGSTIIKADGVPLTIKGNLDLSDKKNLVKQIKTLRIEAMVSDKGTHHEWTLKTIESDQRAGKTEFKYYLQKKGELSNSRDENHDMLGVERRMEF